MIKLTDFFLAVFTTCILVTTQVLLKIWLTKYSFKIFPLSDIKFSPLFSYEFIGAGLSFLLGGVIWLGLLKRIEFSVLYPLISISYIFGLLAAKYIFNESIPTLRWVGVLVIIAGVFLISRN